MNIHQRLPWILIILLGLCASNVFAPAARAQAEKLEVGIDYNYVRANGPPGGCGCFSMNGGNACVGYHLTNSFSVVAEFSGQHAGNINGSGENLTLFSYLFGPRYTLRKSERWLPFGQVLLRGGMPAARLNHRSKAAPAPSTHFQRWLAADWTSL